MFQSYRLNSSANSEQIQNYGFVIYYDEEKKPDRYEGNRATVACGKNFTVLDNRRLPAAWSSDNGHYAS